MRHYVIASRRAGGHLARMDVTYKSRRDRLGLFFQRQEPLSRNAVCKRAKVSESAIGAYLRGTGKRPPRSLSTDTYSKLAAWSGWTIAELMAEDPVPTPDDISSRKGGTHPEPSNDSLANVSNNATRTVGSPESEGDMPDRLFFEIIDRLEDLPPGHLHRLRVLLDRMDAEGAISANPRQAGTAE